MSTPPPTSPVRLPLRDDRAEPSPGDGTVVSAAVPLALKEPAP
ncbi:hypothetical protein [Streptomyces sp. NPDC006335]